MEVDRKTVPSSGSGVTKAALSELGSAPRLGVGGGIGGSETRSTVCKKFCNRSAALKHARKVRNT